jgi:hypothetical protein
MTALFVRMTGMFGRGRVMWEGTGAHRQRGVVADASTCKRLNAQDVEGFSGRGRRR